MSFYFFIFQIILLFFFVFSTLCVPKCSAQGEETHKSVELFELKKQIEVVEVNGGETENKKQFTFKNFAFPFILAVKKGIVTVFEGSYTGDGSSAENPTFDFITTYVDTANREADWGKDFITKTSDKWKVQLSKQYNGDAKEFSIVISAVVSGDNKIYIFAVSKTATSARVSDASQLKVTVIKGTLDDNKNIIKWEKLENNDNSLVEKFTEIFKSTASAMLTFDAFAFLSAEGKPVFVFRSKAKNSDKNFFSFIVLKENEKNKIDVLYSKSDQNCYSYFFLWGDKIMMISTDCNSDGKPTIQKSANMKDWEKSNGPFSRLLDAFQNKEKFATVKINKKEVLLFTQKNCVDNKLSVCLWISDGSRLATFDIVISNENIQFDGSIFYTDGELFALYQKKNGASGSLQEKNTIVLTRLKDVMDKINTVLGEWKTNEKLVLELCGNDQQNAKISCEQQLSTDGLVGFLSGKAGGDNEKWEDNYDYLSANVEKGNKITDGFTFSGPDAGAKWPVSDKSNYKFYNFTDSGFTLIATVTIEKMPEKGEDNSVLGVCTNNKGGGLKNCLRLWCTKKSYWAVSNSDKSDIVTTDKKCDKGSDHVVGLTLEKKNKNIVLYVDGEQLKTASTEKSVTVTVEPEDVISYFYFGVDTSASTKGNAESQVSVKNVLLYNQPLGNKKLRKIKPIKVENSLEQVEDAKFTIEGEGESNAQIDEESTSGNDTHETLATLAPTEEVVLSTSQRESTRYISVSVMCGVWLMLFVATQYQYA